MQTADKFVFDSRVVGLNLFYCHLPTHNQFFPLKMPHKTSMGLQYILNMKTHAANSSSCIALNVWTMSKQQTGKDFEGREHKHI